MTEYQCHIYKKRRAAETTLLQSFICKCATLVYIFIYHSRNEKLLTINKLLITLLEIGAKKSIANDRQIFPLFPDLIDIVTHLIVIYLFHFLHFPTSNIVVYGYKSTK